MADAMPFFVLLFIAVMAWVVYLLLKPKGRRGSRKLPLAVLDNPQRLKAWHDMLLVYDEIGQRQLNDLDIKPFLPLDMQEQLRALHVELRKNI